MSCLGIIFQYWAGQRACIEPRWPVRFDIVVSTAKTVGAIANSSMIRLFKQVFLMSLVPGTSTVPDLGSSGRVCVDCYGTSLRREQIVRKLNGGKCICICIYMSMKSYTIQGTSTCTRYW